MTFWAVQPGERTSKACGSYDRVSSLDETVALIPALRERFGITRIADTTGLDRIAIPTFSAIIPHSPDLLSVYAGKGATREAARVSAVMEAVERQAGAAPNLPTSVRPFRSIIEQLQLTDYNVRAEARTTEIECVSGRDLYSGEPVMVPLAMVQCPWGGPRLLAGGISTNGIAAGTTLFEAIYHALCEVIERHVWSMCHARSALVPKFYGGPSAPDVAHAPEIHFPSGTPCVEDMAVRITDAGFQLRAFWLRENDLPHVMLARVTDSTSAAPMTHTGMGCSLSPAHALLRAMTECVQSRVVDIQGAREDILRAGEMHHVYSAHSRRQVAVPHGSWSFDLPAPHIEFSALADHSAEDLAEDLMTLMNFLELAGKPPAVIVDLTPEACPVAVVRVVIPSFETTAFDGRIGPHVAQLFNPFAVC
ncbi:MAG: YcaO-like family protein [Candidatus Baltobacteraceae bacterium]